MNIKYKTALIIGRFQPFHKGHLFMFREAFGQVEKAIIGIGSINIQDEDNPFTQKQVETMLKNVLESQNWAQRVIQTVGIPDFHDDDKWLSCIKKNCKPFDVVVSSNDWVTGIFKKAKIPVIELPFYKREIYEGKKIRELMRSGGEWKSRVPLSDILT